MILLFHRNKFRLIFSCFLSFFTTFSSAQPSVSDSTNTIFKSFQRAGILQLSLTTDTKKLIKEKYKEEWQPLQINFQDTTGNPITYTAKIRTRGNIRKQVCYYPPLKLKFKKEWLEEQGMDSTCNDLKLVIGCKQGKNYSKLVLKEYLAYQLYEALTDFSFKTQLTEVEIIDTNKNKNPIKSIAFIIENQEEMACRFNGRCTKPRVMRTKSVDKKQLAILTLFNYMIGNTDWEAANSHNIRFIVSRDHPKAIPIAYDFDYSGLVNAPYSVHRESIGIDEITERYFQGRCEDKNYYEAVVPLFIEKKAQLYEIIQSLTLLPKNEQKIMTRYLNEFYEILESPKVFENRVLRACIPK